MVWMIDWILKMISRTAALQLLGSILDQWDGRKKRSAVVHVNSHQRSLPTTQAHYPTTEDTVGFCLLCCQPEPVPLSLSTRTSQLTPRCPCGVPTWSGQAINVARRTWWGYRHFIDQLPLGWQEGATPPSWWTVVLNFLVLRLPDVVPTMRNAFVSIKQNICSGHL